MSEELYIGLMSGTSMDGIDAVLVDFSQGAKVIAHHLEKLPSNLVNLLRQLTLPGDNEIDSMGSADVLLGNAFASAVKNLLIHAKIEPHQVIAIGSHGQTIRHRPNNEFPFTLQIGDPNIIAAETDITTVADFRRKDMALQGDGAPLAPTFHQQFMGTAEQKIILNIGGIANITLLAENNTHNILGFDTGPGNCLMDAWIRLHQQKSYDEDGLWANTGVMLPELLQAMLADNYFLTPPPKSTGTEHFNLGWIKNFTRALPDNTNPADIQRTLLELTAQTIVMAIHDAGYQNKPIYVCGGGVHNNLLMQRLSELHQYSVSSTTTFGVDPDFVEAIAFAWFAKNTLNRKPSNLPSVTGAKRSAVLGGVFYP